MKNLIIGAGIGAVVTMYFMNKKYNKNAELNQNVDQIKDNIKRFIEQSGIQADAEKLANDLTGKTIENGEEISNYNGNVKSKRYVLG